MKFFGLILSVLVSVSFASAADKIVCSGGDVGLTLTRGHFFHNRAHLVVHGFDGKTLAQGSCSYEDRDRNATLNSAATKALIEKYSISQELVFSSNVAVCMLQDDGININGFVSINSDLGQLRSFVRITGDSSDDWKPCN